MRAVPASDIPAHPLLARRSAGVLLHVSSLPGPHGIGDLGPAAHRFVEWLARGGQTFWQTLPVGPIGKGNSPYSSLSAFAGEPLLVSLDVLVRDGLLPRAALKAPASLARGATNYDAARAFKRPRLLAAYLEFVERGDMQRAPFKAFVRRSERWLEDWCAFASAREGGALEYHAFVQFAFDAQWRVLRDAARTRGVRLIGDVPIFVGSDGADVAAHPELFRVRRDGSPEVVTGVPPDSFSETGQLWNHPHYRWPRHRSTHFRWWIERFRRAAELFDLVRIDHFIGFHRAYEIPAGAKTAMRGSWRRAPGRELLRAVRGALGELPLIAEDLGLVTPEVEALRDEFALPGMRIVQNAFFQDSSRDLPCLHPHRSVAYLGTHDNETIAEWWGNASSAVRGRVRAYVGASREAPWQQMLRLTSTSHASLAIVQLQDAIGLGSAGRMNRPGTPRGNWTWRADAAMLSASAARRLHALARATARLPVAGVKEKRSR